MLCPPSKTILSSDCFKGHDIETLCSQNISRKLSSNATLMWILSRILKTSYACSVSQRGNKHSHLSQRHSLHERLYVYVAITGEKKELGSKTLTCLIPLHVIYHDVYVPIFPIVIFPQLTMVSNTISHIYLNKVVSGGSKVMSHSLTFVGNHL